MLPSHLRRALLPLLTAAVVLAGCTAQPTSTLPNPTAGADWPIYTAAEGQVTFAYPPGWSETAPGQFTGADGFARVALTSSQGAGPGAVCQGEANRGKPTRYGATPEIRDIMVTDQPACLILPSADQPADRAGESVLYLWLPAPTADGSDLLILRASREPIQAIAGSLRLTSAQQPASTCDFTPAAQPVEVVRSGAVRIDLIPLARAEGCDPALQPADFYPLISTGEPASRIEQLRLLQTGSERVERLNRTLNSLGLDLQTYEDGLFRLRRGSETLRENISWVGPITVRADQSDFLLPLVDGYNATAHLASRSGVQILDDPDLLVYDNIFPVIAGDSVVRLEYDTTAIPRPPGDPALLRVFRDDEEIQVFSVSGATPSGGPVRGLWSYQGSWFLELPGLVIQDGAPLNERDGAYLGCAEMFGWRLLKDRPFTFCRQQGLLVASYDGETLPVTFDEVIHAPQTGSAQVVQMRAYDSGLGFVARREGLWYYVVVEAE